MWGKKVDKWGEVGHSGAHCPSWGGSDDEDGRKREEVFLGEYFHTLDEKGRVVMPSPFRRRLEDGCVVSKGLDNQLLITPEKDFEEQASEAKAREQDPATRLFNRTMFGGAQLLKPDKSGRVLVKPELREYAGLEPATEIAVVGVFDHVELWEKGSYLADRARGDEMYRDEEV